MGFRWSEVQILSPRPVNSKLNNTPERDTPECYVNSRQHLGNKIPPPVGAGLLQKLLLFQSKNGYTNSYLAGKLGISRAYFSRLLRREKPLTPRVASLIHQFLTGDVYELSFFNPFSAVHSMGRKNKNRLDDLEKVIDNFLMAKQIEGKTKATISFNRGNPGHILRW